MNLASLKSANVRRQKAMEARYPGRVTIAGATYCAAVQIGGVEQRQSATGSGFTPVQMMSASVFKCALSTPPPSRSMITCKGKEWRVDQVAGEDECEVAWQITAIRFPTSS